MHRGCAAKEGTCGRRSICTADERCDSRLCGRYGCLPCRRGAVLARRRSSEWLDIGSAEPPGVPSSHTHCGPVHVGATQSRRLRFRQLCGAHQRRRCERGLMGDDVPVRAVDDPGIASRWRKPPLRAADLRTTYTAARAFGSPAWRGLHATTGVVCSGSTAKGMRSRSSRTSRSLASRVRTSSRGTCSRSRRACRSGAKPSACPC